MTKWERTLLYFAFFCGVIHQLASRGFQNESKEQYESLKRENALITSELVDLQKKVEILEQQ